MKTRMTLESRKGRIDVSKCFSEELSDGDRSTGRGKNGSRNE